MEKPNPTKLQEARKLMGSKDHQYIYVLSAQPSGIQVGIRPKGVFVLQVNGDDPVQIKDADLRRFCEWLHSLFGGR